METGIFLTFLLFSFLVIIIFERTAVDSSLGWGGVHMNMESIVFELSVIIVGSAMLGTIFLYAKQPIIVAYIAIGVVAGPSGFGLVKNIEHIEQISHVGIILLLFLIGLNMQPEKLIGLFKETSLLTFITSTLFATVSCAFFLFLGFDLHSSLLFGAAMMFSSTVVGLKLIPTTALHHRRTGEVMTSVLLLQDVLAILVILFIAGGSSDHVFMTFSLLAGKFVLLCLFAFMGVRYIMVPLLMKFDVVQEYTFLATLGWCLQWAVISHLLGLSYELGAFVAGISIASCRAAIAISEHLKPLREFFLILFFFAIGSNLDLSLEPRLLLSALVFGVLLVPLKAYVFRLAFRKSGESSDMSGELAVRLAQSSEFSLLVAFAALSIGVISNDAAMVIQFATIATIIVSTYWVVLKYPTPISENAGLRRD